MKFLIVNEGSRGEFDSYIGGLKNIDELVNDWYEERENLDIDFRDLQFGGISDKECFLEIIFDEVDCFKIYLLDDEMIESGNFLLSDYYNVIDYKNENDYFLNRRN